MSALATSLGSGAPALAGSLSFPACAWGRSGTGGLAPAGLVVISSCPALSQVLEVCWRFLWDMRSQEAPVLGLSSAPFQKLHEPTLSVAKAPPAAPQCPHSGGRRQVGGLAFVCFPPPTGYAPPVHGLQGGGPGRPLLRAPGAPGGLSSLPTRIFKKNRRAAQRQC